MKKISKGKKRRPRRDPATLRPLSKFHSDYYERKKDYYRKWHRTHRKQQNVYMRRWRREHLEEARAYQREYRRRWRAARKRSKARPDNDLRQKKK